MVLPWPLPDKNPDMQVPEPARATGLGSLRFCGFMREKPELVTDLQVDPSSLSLFPVLTITGIYLTEE